MTTTLTTSGSNSTVTIKYTAASQRVIDTLTAAAELWYSRTDNGALFAKLTAAQKLAVVDDYILRTIIEAAKTQHVLAAQKTAELTAQGELEAKFL